MRVTVTALVVVLAVLAGARAAHADEPARLEASAFAKHCLRGPANDPFPVCFDPGNRLVLQLGYRGLGGGIALRHLVLTDDPGITWRLEHGLAEAVYDGDSWRGALYRGRFLRHSRDGHVMLPSSPPKKLFLPFDIGAEAEVGSFTYAPGAPIVRLGFVRAALLFEVTRSASFQRRLVFGAAARWDTSFDLGSEDEPFRAAEHRVAPFSLAVAGLHLESASGRTVLDIDLEAGPRWSSQHDWGRQVSAQVSLERVVVAVNDRPLSLYCQGGWEDPGRGGWLSAGLRFALVGSTRTRPGR